jgi:hypothetical protein
MSSCPLRSLRTPPAIVMRGNGIAAVARSGGVGIAPLPCFAAAQESGLVRITLP